MEQSRVVAAGRVKNYTVLIYNGGDCENHSVTIETPSVEPSDLFHTNVSSFICIQNKFQF